MPEFDVAEFENYNAASGRLPFLRFHSHLKRDEMLPLPEQHTLNYQALHWELERWTLFNQLPNLYKFDQSVRSLVSQMAAGTVTVPDYLKTVNSPTLWTYWETLPSWARNEPLIRNVMMAMEYRQPSLSIRQKEEALNFACSFLRPLDQQLRGVIAEAANSNKIQLDMKLGTRMLTELQFYTIDPEWLGSESEDYEGEGGDDGKDITQILRASRKDGEEDEEDFSPMQEALKMMDQEHRLDDMRAIADKDMNIESFKVQPATNQCLADFPTMRNPTIDDVQAELSGEHGILPSELPLNYYDNDDGFWDNYIDDKRTRGDQAGFIVRRPFFTH